GPIPSTEINFLIQTASITASEASMYSASVADILVLFLELFQSTAPPFKTKTYPVWDFVSSLLVSNPTSQKQLTRSSALGFPS
ncbi:hypothetical protein Tco_0614188, partial [Tanacetum coccineum]